MARINVYVISQTGSDFVKIGVAADPAFRLLQLQCGNPKNLELVATFSCVNRERAEQVELKAHKSLSAHRCCGEWFSCGATRASEEVIGAIQWVKNRRGNVGYNIAAKRSRSLGMGAGR